MARQGGNFKPWPGTDLAREAHRHSHSSRLSCLRRRVHRPSSRHPYPPARGPCPGLIAPYRTLDVARLVSPSTAQPRSPSPFPLAKTPRQPRLATVRLKNGYPTETLCEGLWSYAPQPKEALRNASTYPSALTYKPRSCRSGVGPGSNVGGALGAPPDLVASGDTGRERVPSRPAGLGSPEPCASDSRHCRCCAGYPVAEEGQ